MKRFALAILVVTAVAAAVLLALNRPGAQASPDVTMTVNSPADTNLRDSVLTLREAMLLATGDLSVPGLAEGECGQISGAHWTPPMPPFPPVCISAPLPGASSADTIDFDVGVFPPGSPATIALGGDPLPALSTNDDIVDGSSAGVIVDGGGDTCFYMNSDNNTIGGSTAAERNVISGTETHGVQIWASDSNTVKGNYIGINADGDTAVRNTFGVWIGEGAQNNTVGGSTAGEGNVISGNEIGLIISDNGTNGNVVKGNYIGINASGTAAIPNRSKGVYLGAPNNTVGGSNPGEGNVISGNDSDGLYVAGSDAQGNVIKGNYIGTDASGTAAVPNGAHGVLIWGGQNNTVGGSTADEGNTIAFNDEHGVQVQDATATGNTIRGNAIHSNGDKGIENIDGGNAELPPPVIDSVSSVFGTACSNCLIDVYSDDEDEGRVYEGWTTADGDGNWSFSGSVGGPNVTATATDSIGNTSEFSNPVAVPVGPTRSVHWVPGWHNATWSGASTPEEVFACAAGNFAAAYRLDSGGWERYFPDRPELSNMGLLNRYDAFLILVTTGL